MGDGSNAPTGVSQVYGKAVDELRSSAKWILGAFAAVGATAFAGLQLTAFGDLDTSRDRWRPWLAGLGFIIAMAGIAAAITLIGRFLAREPMTLRRLVLDESAPLGEARDSLRGDKSILGEIPDAPGIEAALDKWAGEAAVAAGQIADAASDDVRDRARANHAQAQANLLVVQSVAANAVGRARLIEANRKYLRLLPELAVCAAGAAIGVGLFAWAVGQPDVPEEPSRPEIDATIGADDGIRTLAVEVRADGVDHAALGSVVARWKDGEVIFDASFGEDDGSAGTKVSLLLPPGRAGPIEIVADLDDDGDASTVPLSSSLTVEASPTTSTTSTSTTSTATTTTTTTTTVETLPPTD